MKNLFLALCLLSVLAISACGKMSAPEAYPDSGYPHTYPSR